MIRHTGILLPSLPTRSFGSTGESVTAIGLGGAFLAAPNTDAAVATVRRALDRGITYFDTSPMYSEGESQSILGAAFESRSDSHLLATKLGYLPSRESHRKFDALWTQLQDNLRRLRRPRVDVLQVHEADLAQWWTHDSAQTWRIDPAREYDFVNAPVMKVLREAKSQGLCRFIGITGNGEAEMSRLLEVLDVDTILLAFHYDVLNRGATRAMLPLAQRKGVAAILGGIFQCGRLADAHPEWLDIPPKWMTPALRESYRRLYALRGESGLSLVELGIRFVLAEPRASNVLIGASTPDEVDAAVNAALRGPLPPDLHGAVLSLASGADSCVGG